jgi:hypothetical protein
MMSYFLGVALTALATASAFTVDVNIKQCNQAGCTVAKKRVALDAGSNHTDGKGVELVTVAGEDDDELTLIYGGGAVGGPRVYLIEEDGDNKNTVFMLKGQEFTFNVELSTMGCGFNAALYFVGMTANDGGAENGTGYCDAQAVGGTFCSEMDLFEANTEAQQYTTHACVDACGSHTSGVPACQGKGTPSTVCDQSGCGLNPFRYGPGTTYDAEFDNAGWYGPGSGHALDSTKLFTVVTQFHADAATAELTNITRFYLQAGKRIDLPTLYILPPTDGSHMGGFASPEINSGFCTDIYDRWDGGAGNKPLTQMGRNMENGMVLAMSAWYAQETYVNGKPQGSQTGMSWLDGVNNWGKYIKSGPCNTSTTDTAGPYQAVFSDIRIGDIGTTVPNAPPAPPPPPGPPGPPPSTPGSCCYGSKTCPGSNCAKSGYCAASEANCEAHCNGKWCPTQK